MAVMGLDLSLTSSGIVLWDGSQVLAWANPKTTPEDGDDVRRARIVARAIRKILHEHPVDLAWIERYALGQKTNLTRLGELGGVVKLLLQVHKVPYYDEITSTSLKKLATGNGRASKDEMIACATPHWPNVPNDDCADAFHLANQGLIAYRVQTEGSAG